MKKYISFNFFKLMSVGIYFLFTIFLLNTNANAGRIFSFFEIHKPICGTIDLFSNRAKSKIYRELWQQLKVITLGILLLSFLLVMGFNFLTFIFFLYLIIFFNSGRFAVIIARGERITYKVKVLNIKYILRYFIKFYKNKNELILIIITCISSISYATFYFSLEDKSATLILRYLDLLGFTFSFFYQKYLLRGSSIPRFALMIYSILALLLMIKTYYSVNLEFSLFLLIRLVSGYMCIVLLYLKQEVMISATTFLISLSYWSFHLYNDIFSLKVVLLVELLCLLVLVVISFKNRVSYGA